VAPATTRAIEIWSTVAERAQAIWAATESREATATVWTLPKRSPIGPKAA